MHYFIVYISRGITSYVQRRAKRKTKMEDQDIVQLLWNRSEQGLEVLHQKHGSFLFRLAMNFLSNRQDSEECVNDSYLKTWNSIPNNRPNNLKIYVGRILRNLAIDRLRQSHTAKRGKHMTVLLSELEDCIPSTENIEVEYIEKSMIECINRYVRALSPINQQIFVQRYWMNEPVEHISKQVGIPSNKISAKLFQMRKELRTKLETECL